MFEDNVLERDEPALEELESPQSVPGSLHEPNGVSWKEEALVPLREEIPAAKQPASPEPEGGQPPPIGKQHRNSVLHRRPIVSAIGAMLLASALGGGYLYLDYARHFQSTDDAFIAARQSSLAPKVSDYLTAVPVTDNEHVATDDVIARIDDRDYRVALERAEAQVAAAQASIEKTDAQLDVQQAQISANQRRWIRRRQRWCSPSSRRRATSTSSKPAMARFRTPSSTPRNCISSRPRCRARKRA
jgi:membrane fusion protein (multidrug efflux system)